MSSVFGSPSLGNNFVGAGGKSPKGYKQFQNYTPEQMDLFKSLFANVSPDSYLSKLAQGDESTFSEMEAPALRQFNSIQGNLASRFSGMGLGSRNSSGFRNTLNQAASDFSQDLQSRRQALQRQAIQDLMGMGDSLLEKRPYSLYEQPQQRSSFLQRLFGGISGLAGAGLGGLFGGSSGAALGGQLGSGFGNAFR